MKRTSIKASELSFCLRNLRMRTTMSHRLLLSERLMMTATTRATLHVSKPFRNLTRYNNGRSRPNRSNCSLSLILTPSFPSFPPLLSLFLSLSVSDTLFLIMLTHQGITYFDPTDSCDSIDHRDIEDLRCSRCGLANPAPRLATGQRINLLPASMNPSVRQYEYHLNTFEKKNNNSIDLV